MSASTAIGLVSESLRNLLVGEMQLSPAIDVTILAPDEGGGNRRINLFLYQVQENPTFKNMDWHLKPGSANVLVPPPLSLNLFYLMTPYAQNDSQTGNTTAHAILGEAMRVFYENPIVPQEYLADGLEDAREQLQIIQNTLDMEELARVWSTFTQPFRLSILYQISVVQLDTLPASERTMPQRVRQIGVPEVRAPFSPPVVNSVTPLSGTVGASITFQGQHLVGWRASVRILRRTILNAQELTQDQFTMTIPNDLPPGFHEIRVDISNLFRKTFFFEVTA
jgi:Pvc16 N-terminal domain/IPT/TIG domain